MVRGELVDESDSSLIAKIDAEGFEHYTPLLSTSGNAAVSE